MKVEVVVYYADWCGPCHIHRKALEDFDYVLEVNVNDAQDDGVSRVPFTVLRVDDRVVKRHEGAMTTEQFKDWMGEYDPEKSL